MSGKRRHPGGRRRRGVSPHHRGSEVGYARPPKAHQFKPGQSGNPNGRPKGVKNESTILRALLHRKIEVRVAGRLKKVTILEAILLRMAEDSLKGDTKSAAFLLNRFATRVSGEAPQSTFSEDEEEIFEAFVQKLQSPKNRARK